VTTDEAVRAYQEHDWNAESAFEHQLLVGGGEELCPPGIGFVQEPGHILHVCPGVEDALVHYHFKEVRRLLGLLPFTRPRVFSAPVIPLSQVPDLIRFFASGQLETLRARLAQPPLNKALQLTRRRRAACAGSPAGGRPDWRSIRRAASGRFLVHSKATGSSMPCPLGASSTVNTTLSLILR